MKLLKEWESSQAHVGKRVCIYDDMPSTNSHCLELTDDPSNRGLVVIARSQSAGRGQHGRHWLSEPGMGLWMSTLVGARPELTRPVILTAWAAVSVCEVIANVTELDASIKWPNDVLIDDRKVCGILIEQRAKAYRKEQTHPVVVGIGWNLNQTQGMFDESNLPFAGSLYTLTGRSYGLESMARELISVLDRNYGQLAAGHLELLERQWSDRLGLVGRSVQVEGNDQTFNGRLLELSFDGIMIESENPSIPGSIIAPENVRHIWKAPTL
ncbi:MAG: biotin--[acetyl-CoA-carboxylase] ligase [Gemmataceae bacterium]